MTDHAPAFPQADLGGLLELDPNGAYAPLPRLCERLAIPLAPQVRRARKHPVLRGGFRVLKLENDDGELEKQPCLRVDLVPLWLIGLDAEVDPALRATVASIGSEAASLAWQAFKPQGFVSDDQLVPDRFRQSPAETAYVGQQAIANLARQQMLLERQISADRAAREEGRPAAELDPQAVLLAQTVRRVATTLAERSRRNEYPGIFDGLYRQWGIASYRRMPPARLREALEWLERWYGDAIGEPEPEPDI
ncbi:MAG TPA: hypothetical protein VGE07_12720 [Herpetosiphonaceae bacterium]